MSAPTAVLDRRWLLLGGVSASLRRWPAGEAVAEAALATLAGPWHLAVLDGSDRGLVIAVRDDAFLGRGKALNDPLVLRHHLRPCPHGDRVLTQDCGSANGSYHYWYLRLWLHVRQKTGMKEGTLLRPGDNVLELRRRPCDLVVAAPAAQALPTVWLMVSSLVCVLVIGGPAVIALRMGSRDATGTVMVAPTVTMTIMCLIPFLQ